MPHTLKIDLNGGQIGTLYTLTAAPLASVTLGRRPEFTQALTRIASLMYPYSGVDDEEGATIKLDLTRYEKAALNAVLAAELDELTDTQRSDRTSTYTQRNVIEIMRAINDYEEALAAL